MGREARASSEARAGAGGGAALSESFGELRGAKSEGGEATGGKEKEGSREGGGLKGRRRGDNPPSEREATEAKEASAGKESQRRSEETSGAKHGKEREREAIARLMPHTIQRRRGEARASP